MNIIKAVIFDVEGTLVDNVDLHANAWREAFRHFGHEIPLEAMRHQIGKAGNQLLPVFLSHEELYRRGEAIEKYRREIYKNRYLRQARAFPRVRELFARIKALGQHTALVSSCKSDEPQTYKKLAEIDDLVTTEIMAGDTEKSKQDPDIFRVVLDRLEAIEPAEAIVVGDSPYDAQGAAKIGLRTVGLLCGGFSEDQLRAAGCVAIFSDPADLLDRYDDFLTGLHSA